MQTLLYNATLVLPERLIENGWLLIENERIAALGEGSNYPTSTDRQYDAEGAFVLPGLIDLHCDSIEKLVEPRPNVQMDIHVALMEVDRRLAACGITTEFHAVSLDDNEFGVRSNTFVGQLAQSIKDETESLIRHKIHARLELTSEGGYKVIEQLITGREVRLVSIMNHSPGQGQYTTEQAYRDYVKRTAHMTDAQIDALLALKREQTRNIPERIAQVSKLVREVGLALATHDDDSAEKVEQWPALGVTMAEFPTTMEAARRAHELGLAVCMGAPNVLRGKSSGGNLSALDAIQAGVTNVLCADYYPAAMLASVFKLVTQQVLSLPEATKLVTLNPAHAVGLDKDFGSLEVGKLADFIVVSLNQRNHPRVVRLFVAGRERFHLPGLKSEVLEGGRV